MQATTPAEHTRLCLTPLTLPTLSAGKPLSKCGKCRRYMKFIAARPSRLYCPVCEDIYNLPQGGSIKLYKV